MVTKWGGAAPSSLAMDSDMTGAVPAVRDWRCACAGLRSLRPPPQPVPNMSASSLMCHRKAVRWVPSL